METNEAKPLVWSELWAAMKSQPDRWQLTTEDMYYEMLDVVPPRDMGAGAFLVGEPERHNSQGEAVYACFRQIGEEYEARYMTHREFRQFLSIRSAQVAA